MPNGVAYEVQVMPGRDAVDMSLRIRNGSSKALKNVRGQICVLLKGAPGFNAQTKDNKRLLEAEGGAAVRSDDGRRWIATVWERGRAWQNPPCPCIHSDPAFPDLAPGAEATVKGTVFFHEGAGVDGEIRKRGDSLSR
jgi:hypothetical protein